MGEPNIRAGATALRKFLTETGQSVPAFCERHGIERLTVQRYLRGERRRLDVDICLAIERATGGVVPVALWERIDASGEPTPSPTGTHG